MKKQNEKIIEFEPEFLNRKTSAKYLGISLAKFDQLKDISCIRYGKRKVYSISVLRDYANKHSSNGER